jgi:hypothetical protein
VEPNKQNPSATQVELSTSRANTKRRHGYMVRIAGPHAARFAGRIISVMTQDGTQSEQELERLVWSGPDHESGQLVALYSSGVSAVTWDKRETKWHASIKTDGEQKSLGHFTHKTEAVLTTDLVRLVAHGEFARLIDPCGPFVASDALFRIEAAQLVEGADYA